MVIIVLITINSRSLTSDPFSLAVVDVCSYMLALNVTSSPLPLKGSKLPLFICLQFSSMIFETNEPCHSSLIMQKYIRIPRP